MAALRTSHSPTRRCMNCGARIALGTPGACVFCGAQLPLTAIPALSKARRFELLRRHPSLPRLLERKPSTAGLMRVNGAVFFVLCAIAVPTGILALSAAAAGDVSARFYCGISL